MEKEKKLVQVASRVTVEEREKMLEYCADNDITLSQLIRRAVRDFLNK